jgi:amino acid transporter
MSQGDLEAAANGGSPFMSRQSATSDDNKPERLEPGLAARPSGLRKRLLWHHLVGLTFFAVCGGDYGMEESVGAAGPALALAGVILLPWFWSLPIALMTSELGSMIPEAGGYVVWIHRAFGFRMAHLNATWNLVSNTFDNALYPVMFVDYLAWFPLLRMQGLLRWLVSVAMLACVTFVNILGVDVVAGASSLFALLTISPFVALVIAGMPKVRIGDWWEERWPSHEPVRWGPFLSVLLWNTSGYDSVGALAGEVRNPGRDLPLSMLLTIILVTLVYLLPLAVAVSLDAKHVRSWTDGRFVAVASESVGDWLAAWISLGGALAAAGLLNTLLCTSARVAMSAARYRILPAALAKVHEKSGTPRAATLAISAVLAVACALPFAQLVSISMLFYGATT